MTERAVFLLLIGLYNTMEPNPLIKPVILYNLTISCINCIIVTF